MTATQLKRVLDLCKFTLFRMFLFSFKIVINHHEYNIPYKY